MDAIFLARMQFAANITFHILFPSISIALGWLLLFFRFKYLRATDPHEKVDWLRAYRLWTKVFALTFALGVVSGVTMSFQFGTNWPGYMERVGNIAGPLLGYEVLTAFFLEAGFLGVMLFGHRRVGEIVHLGATVLVAFGTLMSAFWILALNSWMQTPAGYEIVNGQFHARSWLEIIFNPSFPYRLVHMVLASALTCAFLLIGISSWQILKGVAVASASRVLRAGLVFAALAAPAQIVAGDFHGLNTLKHQPQKIAAVEGIWETARGVPLLLFAIPDDAARTNRFELGVPRLASLILRHDLDGELKGLNEFPSAHPPVLPLFWSFRIMVGMGTLMLLISWLGLWRQWRDNWDIAKMPRLMLRVFAAMTFAGWVATVAGWYVTEIGRQPFIVSGLIRTADVASRVPSSSIAVTFAIYVAVYLSLLVAYVGVLKYMAETADKKSYGNMPASLVGEPQEYQRGGEFA
ncbi:cytochrome ubiquinol oxidase subunit I [Bradyrhizobium sp. CCGUVB4N]|uniref:cytochrome ubiquinol oxidase subunit I n=1 Tax=Bradyrhizobium sp. CCGUVB4N TaxID=2949631 RepID=UPI0020B36D96|nr:cytochrome ubiquinol oxidase subunit I [Bradyrhizobium sp. CCGUVB4N]MCP3379918.1 cytochrome ubiquinol oxidase subunit I [Bradyrhizobium sp. CCGUVB4N]